MHHSVSACNRLGKTAMNSMRLPGAMFRSKTQGQVSSSTCPNKNGSVAARSSMDHQLQAGDGTWFVVSTSLKNPLINQPSQALRIFLKTNSSIKCSINLQMIKPPVRAARDSFMVCACLRPWTFLLRSLSRPLLSKMRPFSLAVTTSARPVVEGMEPLSRQEKKKQDVHDNLRKSNNMRKSNNINGPYGNQSINLRSKQTSTKRVQGMDFCLDPRIIWIGRFCMSKQNQDSQYLTYQCVQM